MKDATNWWFGDESWCCATDGLPKAETPVGQSCLHCGEPIADGDRGYLRPFFDIGRSSMEPMHMECDFRRIVGGAECQRAHANGTHTSPYHCTPDDPALTKREAALAAWETWRELNGVGR